MGLRPAEFWRLTPADCNTMIAGFYEQEMEREKSAYRREAYFTALLMNATGNYKRHIRPEELVNFSEKTRAKPMSEAERRQQVLETARFHKTKCWKLIKGRTIDDVKLADGGDKAIQDFIKGK